MLVVLVVLGEQVLLVDSGTVRNVIQGSQVGGQELIVPRVHIMIVLIRIRMLTEFCITHILMVLMKKLTEVMIEASRCWMIQIRTVIHTLIQRVT